MVVGEAPGRLSIERGAPFMGTSGMRMLRSVWPDLDRRVHFADAVRCLPAGNRTPRAAERAACRPFLLREIALLRPRRIVCLGRIAFEAVTGERVAVPVPRWLPLRRGRVIAIPHPAYAMRQRRAYRARYLRLVRRFL